MVTPKAALRLPMKFILVSWNNLRDSAVVKVILFMALVLATQRKNTRLRYTAVKNEQMRPMMRVVAKPLMGPVPKYSRMMPVMMDVKLPSKIALKALE